jgi:hypothetical protein
MRLFAITLALASSWAAVYGCGGAHKESRDESAALDAGSQAGGDEGGSDEAAAPIPVAAGFDLNSVLCSQVDESDPEEDVYNCSTFDANGVTFQSFAVRLPDDVQGITVKVEPIGSALALADSGVSRQRVTLSGDSQTLAAMGGRLIVDAVLALDGKALPPVLTTLSDAVTLANEYFTATGVTNTLALPQGVAAANGGVGTTPGSKENQATTTATPVPAPTQTPSTSASPAPTGTGDPSTVTRSCPPCASRCHPSCPRPCRADAAATAPASGCA